MNYRLYYSPFACSLAVHIVLEELGLPFELQLVSVQQGATQRPDYLAINPKGRVPALQMDGQILTEITAILFYLGDTYGRGRLLPNNPLAAARCMEWIGWLSSEVHPAFGQIWRPERSVTQAQHQPDVAAKGLENVKLRLAEIEEKLAQSPHGYAAGDGYSIVDPYVMVYTQWAQSVGIEAATIPAMQAHKERLLQRPAVQVALTREQQALNPLKEAG